MKNLRIVCFALAIINILLFIRNFYQVAQQQPIVIGNQDGYNSQLVVGYVVTIITVIFVVILAGKLNRSRFGWGLFSLFLPWLAGIIIALLKPAEYKPRTDYDYTSPNYPTSTYISQKTCSACGRSVSLSSSAGQRCPYCGVYWSTERRMNS